MSEYFFSFDHVHHLVKNAAQKIEADQFKPDYILAIGSGGFIPARILKTFIETPIITITACSYDDEKKASTQCLKIEQWIEKSKIEGKNIIVVDDIDDTRATLNHCLRELLLANPNEIGLFVLHNKNKAKSGSYPSEVKKIYYGETIEDWWINYPWEFKDINEFNQKAKGKTHAE